MKKSLIALCITCALVLVARADDEQDKKAEGAKKREATPEQKAIRKEMLDKYDANKDGKLDESERAKISEADKAKLKEATKNADAAKKEKSDTAK